MIFVAVVCGITSACLFAVCGVMAAQEHPAPRKIAIVLILATSNAVAAAFALVGVLQ